MIFERDRLEEGRKRYSLQNAKHWISTETGSHLLLDEEGNVVGGAGGKLKDKKFVKVTRKSKDVEGGVSLEKKLEEKVSKEGLKTADKKPKNFSVTSEVKVKLKKQGDYATQILALAAQDRDARAKFTTSAQHQKYRPKLRDAELDSFAANALSYLKANVDAKYGKEKIAEYNERFGGMGALSGTSAYDKAAFLNEIYTDISKKTEEREATPLEKTRDAVYQLAKEKVAHDKQARLNYEALNEARAKAAQYERYGPLVKQKEKELAGLSGDDAALARREIANLKQYEAMYEPQKKKVSELEKRVKDDDKKAADIETRGRAMTRELEALEKESGSVSNSSPIRVYRASR